MCEYCDFDNEKCYEKGYGKGDVRVKQLYGSWTSLGFEHDVISNKTVIIAIGDDEVSLPIHYCPICGRKLD